jgi:ParB family chromosome partitioning protein
MALPIGHLERVRGLAISGRLVAVSGVRTGAASSITLYDVVSEKPQGAIELPCHVQAMAGTPAGFVAGGHDGQLRRITGTSVDLAVRAHDGVITALAIWGDRVASVGVDGALREFSLADGRLLRERVISNQPLRSVAFDPTGEAVATGGDDGVVRVVSAGAVREMPGHDGPVFGLAFTPTSDRVVSAGDDGTLRIWYLVGPVESDVRGAGETGHSGGATGVLFLPGQTEIGTERFVSCGLDGKLKVWRMNEKRRPRSLDTPGNAPLYGLTWFPRKEGGAVLVGGEARTVWAYGFDEKGTPSEKAPIAYGHGFDVLGEALKAPAVPKRLETVRALVALDEPEALDLVVRAMANDREAQVRTLAATELAQRGRTAATRAIRERLEDGQATVRMAAFAALRKLQSETPLTPIRSALATRQPDVRTAAVVALPALAAASPLATALLIERLGDESPVVRRAALAAYRGMEPAPSALPLRAAFERGQADVRADALALVAKDGLTDAVEVAPIVAKALDDADAIVRRVAFVAVALTKPALARWLQAHDAEFVKELEDVARRGISMGSNGDPAREPTAPEVTAAVGSLLVPGEATVPGETERGPLLSALACRTSDTALRGARGLARLGDLRALGALLTLSREPDAGLRRSAAQALASLPDPRARRRLAWMLNDGDSSVRDVALQCLGTLEAPLDVAERALHAGQEDIRTRGLVSLVQHGTGLDRGEQLLGDALDDESAKVRGEAFRTLWAWNRTQPIEAIDRALGARFPDIRRRGVSELLALAKEGPFRQPAVERLSKIIADSDEGVAKAAYDAVLELEGKPYADAHRRAMASSLPNIRTAGVIGARHARPEDARSALVERLQDTVAAVRSAAIDTLDFLFPHDNEAVRVGLRVSHLDTRVRAAEHLALRRDESIVEPMLAILRDEELKLRQPHLAPALRQGAAMALATLGSVNLLEPYNNILVPDEDGHVREQGARGLANACRPENAQYLVALLGHNDIAVRSWAGEGLARLGDPRGVPVLTGTLRHQHPPIRVGAILAFAALGPEGYGGLLQGLEDPSPDVQRILLSVVLARDLAAYRNGEPPELLSSALASVRPEVRFAAARAIELRTEPGAYLSHLVEVLLPERPEKAPEPPWPDDEETGRLMVALAMALAGDVPQQRYAALQVLRLRDRPHLYFREAARLARPRVASQSWVPENTPRAPAEGSQRDPLRNLRSLFNAVSDRPAKPVSSEEEAHLYRVAFGAYVGLLRQVAADDEAHRVRRDAIDRITDLVSSGRVARVSAVPSLARALDDPHHLVRRGAFVALKRLYGEDAESPLSLALLSSAADVLRQALDDLAVRGPSSFSRIAQALDSPVPDARRYAFEVLERISPKGSLEPLLAALRSQHADLRIGVLERLATSSDPRVAEALGTALLSDHEDLRLRAAELLAARKDDRAVDLLEAALRSEEARGRARNALARIGSPAAVRALASRFDDAADPTTGPNERERLDLLEALREIRGAAALEVVIARFSDESEDVRDRAFDVGMDIAGPRPDLKRSPGEPEPRPRDPELAHRVLEAAVRARAPELRASAARELDVLPKSEADALLASLFADRHRDVRVAAVRSYAVRVEKHGADPAPLEAVLKAGARELGLAAARGLASRRTDAGETSLLLRTLLLYSRAGDDAERPEALLGLGTLGDLRALPELEQVAAGGTEEAPVDPPMQAAAIEALGKLDRVVEEPEAHERIRDRIETSLTGHANLAVAAVKALGHLGGERARARLEGVVSTGYGGEQKVEAIRALGEMGDPASEKVLAEAMEDWWTEVRWAAREALYKLFPNERNRVELHAVESGQNDLAEPAAAYLARHGDAGSLLTVLGSLEDDQLREKLRFGLVSRDQVSAQDLATLLGAEAPAARSDAAWVVGTRPIPSAPADRSVLEAALAQATDRARRGWEQAQTRADEEAATKEERAWLHALWAGRRLAQSQMWAAAEATLLRSDAPVRVRVEAAHALKGSGSQALAKAATSSVLEVRYAAVSAAGTTALAISPADPVVLARAAPTDQIAPGSLANTTSRQVLLPVALRTGQVGQLLDLAKNGAGRDQLDAINALSRSRLPTAGGLLSDLAIDQGRTPEVRKAAYRAARRWQRAQKRAERARTEATS